MGTTKLQGNSFDVIVVGGGHAGAEAAAAAAHLGVSTLLITQNLDTIGQMSCNPAMGGVAKGQIVREIDALGGLSALVTDASTLQYRMLNRSKGPAMWSPRAQCDRMLFAANWRRQLEHVSGLSLWQDEVVDLTLNGSQVSGVVTRLGLVFTARAVVLTAGTFLNGRIYIGEQSWPAGRIGEAPAVGLSDRLRGLGFEVQKLKTGTPVRIDGRTINFAALTVQPGDDNPMPFSFLNPAPPASTPQKPCFIANTNLHTHDVLRTGFDRSPMFTGRIQGRGPRYCPSIEDKIERFADKDHHQLFVEPEGWHSESYYLNGFSSSLPLEVQLEALHTIEGFEQAAIFKPGYAIEYDYFPPTQLGYTLETRAVEGLYFAGQVNGTTGYEEAACQGLVAGINAALKIQDRDPFVLSRTDAYIGVLIDDLVTKGVDEPYRMFTSRAEHRILLRQDNADRRLTPLGHAIGLASDERMRRVERKSQLIDNLKTLLAQTPVLPSQANAMLERLSTPPIQQRVRLESLLLRPEVALADLETVSPELADSLAAIPSEIRAEVAEGAEIEMKYSRYIEKEQEVAARLLKFEDILLPPSIDYHALHALSYEAREKLSRMKPHTLGQASRISGVSPADVAVLMVMLK
ncbi:MAG: tRNA uridine-5-carboxymethylaminomethyl(34) synthesis enzyme MnmG [Bacteroidales bacterium]|nr:tRNA uridine-5-carboxymethylaminomethyl(34) synthesis enzyme MnmG [Bacteroidales bacterium]